MKLSDIKTKEEFANFLGIKVATINFFAYGPGKNFYSSFEIPKRNGKSRKIYAPTQALKTIQKKISIELEKIFEVNSSSYGFIRGKDITKNARNHLRHKVIYNLDIEDFFPSFTFPRIRGMLLNKPYDLSDSVATLISQLACYESRLVQGSPCSPIISNMMCKKLDSKMIVLAKENRLTYTRYADDLTFSTFSDKSSLDEKVQNSIIKIIEDFGLKVNSDKIEISEKSSRQEVTGIVVNKKMNVKREFYQEYRTLLHICKKKNIYEAACYYANRSLGIKDAIRIAIENEDIITVVEWFKKVLNGKQAFFDYVKSGKIVKDKNYDTDSKDIVKKYKNRLNKIYDSDYGKYPKLVDNFLNNQIVIVTEGKTDAIIIKKAFISLKLDVSDFIFKSIEDYGGNGDADLMTFIDRESKKYPSQFIIGLYDRDSDIIINKFKNNSNNYRRESNGVVYSAILPQCLDRKTGTRISIENYFKDCEIHSMDSDDKRLFMVGDFHANGFAKHDDSIICEYIKDLPNDDLRKLENHHVLSGSGTQKAFKEKKNVSLTKMAFASYIDTDKDGFNNFNYENFKLLHNLFMEIRGKMKTR